MTMGIYEKYILPKVVHHTCGQRPAMRQREKVVPLAEGRVLEIGIGSGLNLPFYQREKVDHIWGLDPSEEMWAIARKKAETSHLDVEFLKSGAEEIPLDTDCADTVMMTFTLCTITGTDAALAEIRRVLKPGGKLIFCEHGAAPDENIRLWQDRINPVWRRLAGGCHLNRAIPGLIEAGGFQITNMETMYLPGWKFATFNYWGQAKPF
jgi:ubiquinone/menaquinone biosynthesis C-methylase UbiE